MVSDVTDGPGERRRRLAPEERRAGIVAAAAVAFDQESFDRVAVADVARAAGTSEALVYHYFPSKADLYAGAVGARLGHLGDAAEAAVAALGRDASARDQVRAVVLAHLDHVAKYPAAWAGGLDGVGAEPPGGVAIREAARQRRLDLLAGLLLPDPRPERHYALAGHVAQVDGLSRDWVRRGRPEEERASIVTVALGALQGALGDWGR